VSKSSNSKYLANNYRFRHSYATTIPKEVDNLISIQTRSYAGFLQTGVNPEDREDVGLQSVFNSVFPISDFNGKATLEFLRYDLQKPNNDVDECREKGLTYAAQLKVQVRMNIFDLDEETKEPHFSHAQKQQVFFGDIPLMTENGTFVVNGTERVVVSQLHRSPGVFFSNKISKTTLEQKTVLTARIIPNRGSWIDFEFDTKDRLHVRIDRRKKLPAIYLLLALGYDFNQLLRYFYPTEKFLTARQILVVTSEEKDTLRKLEESLVDDVEQSALHSIVKKTLLNCEEGMLIAEDCFQILHKALQKSPFETESGYWVKRSTKETLSKGFSFSDYEYEILQRGRTSKKKIKKGKKFLKNNILHLEQLSRFHTEKYSVLGKEYENRVVDLPSDITEIVRTADPFLYTAVDIVNEDGEIIIPFNTALTHEVVEKAIEEGITDFTVLFIDGVFSDSSLRDAFEIEAAKLLVLREKRERDEERLKERNPTYEEKVYTDQHLAILEIFQKMRPADPANLETAQKSFHSMLFDPNRYDLSVVGRIKVNQRLYSLKEREAGVCPEEQKRTLQHEDLLRVIRYLYDLKSRREGAAIDDIDHLGNRRVRSVGELLINQFRIGLVRMEKAIKERMSLGEIANMAPNDIINAKPVTAIIKEFFGASQLSQFMDQTNPLSEITHKRRLSALGPGGLTRERAGNEVRDVHATHYGRICPVETPEGPNVGLIASLASYARVNKYGFIETPYRKCVDGKLTGDVKYYSALDEKGFSISQAAIAMRDNTEITAQSVIVRQDGDIKIVQPQDVNLIDVSPNQMVSVAASLVPFLENDDANRALMGANMQRQAVPLIKSRAPLVGTGMEAFVARDAGVTTTAKRNGVVTDVDATRIVVHADAESGSIGGDVDIYNLTKFRRSNQNTCINQRPLVNIGDRVEAGKIIADGPATEIGELALGQNVIVAFMPWQGYNFEDSILLSERLVQDDVYTSIHIEEYEVSARDTKLGKEEITRDIPNINEDALRNLDDAGIIRVGSFVKQGDILVGKVTPKGESQLSPEEKLLRAIFGEKAGDVKDTSLKAKPGVQGVVMGAQVFAREGIEMDTRALEIMEETYKKIDRDLLQNIKIIQQSAMRQMGKMLIGHQADLPVEIDGEIIIEAGVDYTKENLRLVPFDEFSSLTVADQNQSQDIESKIWSISDQVAERITEVADRFEEKKSRLSKGDELSPGVIKMVKVYIAIKRKLQVGDKMAGRHGNKGVVSRVMPIENMPYLEDGTPVDVVLNPLGVPSRMNVGQVLETHLGWAARGMGVRIQSMIEEKQREILGEIKGLMIAANQLPDHLGSASLDELVEFLQSEDNQQLLSKYTKASAQHCEDLREYLLSIYEDTGSMEDFLREASYEKLKELAAKYKNGVTVATPVFSGVREDRIRRGLKLAGFDDDGKTILYDGRTGEPFQNRVTVGVMYVLKLHHLVDEKIHARSIGPYSLVTQQPLGGKAQFGGQRLGEMEVWALEAYGAAYTLQEFLTVKSDDVQGRTRMYESIVKGDNELKAGLPESFNVLIKELEALALKVELDDRKDIFP
jgi:DNA-directed RNA polymerase subunit beta